MCLSIHMLNVSLSLITKKLYIAVIWWHMYLLNPSTTGKIWHKVIFLGGVQLVWIQVFPSRLVALPRLKNPICLTTYS